MYETLYKQVQNKLEDLKKFTDKINVENLILYMIDIESQEIESQEINKNLFDDLPF